MQADLAFPQSLAEKYRPVRIADFIGLERPKKVLSAFCKRPASGAWLFVGPSGVGKSTMALALATELAAELHKIPSQKCNAQSIEDTVRQCWYAPMAPGGFNVVLANEADQMTNAAQLALLSKLDSTDPAPNTIWIFTANDTERLERRFLSRCKVLEFSSYGLAAEIVSYLDQDPVQHRKFRHSAVPFVWFPDWVVRETIKRSTAKMTSAVRGTESSDAQRKIASPMLKAAYAFVFAAILSGSAHAQASHRSFDGEVHNNALAISPDERTAILSYGESPDVVIYDLEAKNVRAVLNHFITPRNIVFESNGRFFYVSDSTLGVVEKIDTTSLKTIAVFHANPGAFGMTFSKNARTLYVNNEAATIVWAFDLALERPFTLITAYSQPHQGARPLRDGSPLYVIDFRGDKIRIVDIATNQFSGEIPGFSGIRAISVTRDGKTIFAANSAANSIAVVDASSRSIIKQIPIGKDPYSVALSSDERFVYSGNLADNTLSVVALSSLQVVATISGFSELAQAIVFTRGFDAYVLDRDLRISRVGLPTNRVVYTIPTRAGTEATSF